MYYKFKDLFYSVVPPSVTYTPSGVESTSETSTSEELCVAKVRRTVIDDETNIIIHIPLTPNL